MGAISVDNIGTIDLGRQGENLARSIEIDVTGILAKWPKAIITLLVKRKGDSDPYFAEATVHDGILTWPITKVETAVAGDGKIEIQAVDGDVIVKSVTGTIRVNTSLSGSASDELPDVRPSWVDQVLNGAGAGGSGGTVTDEQISSAVEKYMTENPVQETDPTVPVWAKQPEKPKYTADEVGAQPKGNYALKSEIPEIPAPLHPAHCNQRHAGRREGWQGLGGGCGRHSKGKTGAKMGIDRICADYRGRDATHHKDANT